MSEQLIRTGTGQNDPARRQLQVGENTIQVNVQANDRFRIY